MHQFLRITILLGLIAMGFSPSVAQKRSLNLERLVREAGIIFAGRVIGVETGTKDRMNIYRTFYTFEVLDGIYGVEGDTIEIKQYGGEADGKSFYPGGVPRFSEGEEVLVLLYPPSSIGLTSTVGREQGKFIIAAPDSNGIRTLGSTLDAQGLFGRLRHPGLIANEDWLAGEAQEPLDYNEFVQTLRNLVAVLKKKN